MFSKGTTGGVIIVAIAVIVVAVYISHSGLPSKGPDRGATSLPKFTCPSGINEAGICDSAMDRFDALPLGSSVLVHLNRTEEEHFWINTIGGFSTEGEERSGGANQYWVVKRGKALWALKTDGAYSEWLSVTDAQARSVGCILVTETLWGAVRVVSINGVLSGPNEYWRHPFGFGYPSSPARWR